MRIVYAHDMVAMRAGTKYRGDFEQQLKPVLKQLVDNPNAILFIDEIHTVIGAGAASGGTLDASNLLKPVLSTGQLKCIGATTYNEYRGVFEKDHALSRRFQKIDVVEPSVDETVEILKGLKTRFEAHHSVKYTANALTTAAELSARYINDRHLPDKAIDVIDEAGAAQRIAPKAKQKRIIGKAEIEEIIAKIARIPPRSVSTDDRSALANLDRDLKAVVFGQDRVIDALASAIKMARSGLGNPQKPIGNFLFSGPTGVGKTEVARQLAYCMGIELIRFDMSEYMERHAVSRLIGAPPGYVGFDQGGLLTEAISKKPHAVLLMDEIEKAHPDVFNVLLQVMDHGTLTDNNGRKADFRNVIIVMTTNAGAEAMSKATIGFTNSREQGDEMADIKRLFTPEFRNRLDATVSFRALDEEIILRVVDKFLLQLESQLAEKKVEVTFTDALRKHLAKKGFDPMMGARPMQRLIQDTIRRALADELLFGRLVEAGIDVFAEMLVLVADHGHPLLARRPVGQRRHAIGDAVAHVEHMRELVDHDVVAPLGGLAGGLDIAPRQHHRAAFHRLAGQRLVVVVNDARFVHHLAPRDDLVAVHHDADEAIVAIEPEPQHRQAGLRRDRHRDLVADLKALRAGELLACEKECGEFAQHRQVDRAAPREKGIARQRQLPQRVGDRPAPQDPLVVQPAPAAQPAVEHGQRGAVAGAMRTRPSRRQRSTSARAGPESSRSQSLSTWRSKPGASRSLAGRWVWPWISVGVAAACIQRSVSLRSRSNHSPTACCALRRWLASRK